MLAIDPSGEREFLWHRSTARNILIPVFELQQHVGTVQLDHVVQNRRRKNLFARRFIADAF